MKLKKSSTIEDVIEAVGRALQAAGIEVVLVGGACATVYSGGLYESGDLDLIVRSAPTQKALDRALASIGFRRHLDEYRHELTDYVVEFPRGPISLGHDLRIKPVLMKAGRARVPALSATDSCRDRLMHFFAWNDPQAFDAAIAIALRNPVNLSGIRRWSASEGMTSQYELFREQLLRARKKPATGKKPAHKRRSRTARPR